MNILLIVGITAVILPLKVSNHTTYKDIPVSLFTVVLLGILVSDRYFWGSEENMLSNLDGWILLGFFTVYMTYTFYYTRNNPGSEQVKKKA